MVVKEGDTDPLFPLPWRLPARSRFGEGRGEGADEGERRELWEDIRGRF